MKLYLTILITVFSQIALAQSGWNWPMDSVQARQKASIYPELMETSNFDAAKENFDWLIANAPNLNVSLYINGVKLYDSLISREDDSEIAFQYTQKLLNLFDQRINYFGKEDINRVRKAFSAYRLLKNDQSQLSELDDIVNTALNTPKKDIPESLYLIQADVLRRMNKSDLLNDTDKILQRFDQLLDSYANNLNKKEATENKLYVILKSMVKFDCSTLESWLMPKLRETPEDTLLAKRLLSLSYSVECTNQDFFLQTADILVKTAPSYGVLKILGTRREADGNFKAALDYYQKAEDLTTDPKDVFEMKYRQARLHQRAYNYAKAYSLAKQCISLNNSDKRPIELIGDLWYGSFESCKNGKSIVGDRGVYLAAYQWYEKAGNQKKMKLAAQQFPSIEEIFGELKKEGEQFSIENCWGQEKVTIRRRSNVNQ
ncbi:MAG: hypothetical protein AAFQ94_09580 [Bacteroidota bacterium]